MGNILTLLENILTKDSRLVSEGKLLRNKIIELSSKLDGQLLHLLFQEPSLANYFFTEVDGIKVFDRRRFQTLVNNKQFLPDSYTSFKIRLD